LKHLVRLFLPEKNCRLENEPGAGRTAMLAHLDGWGELVGV
jgi:hypothetical protein